MKVFDLKQGSQDWHDFRRLHIGSSDSPIVAGESPWCTPLILHRRKLGLEPEQPLTPPMQRGIALEPIALAIVNKKLGIELKPVVGESDEFPYLSASFDGFNFEHGIALEIKCPGVKAHQTALDGKVPSYYYGQLQKQMYVADLQWIYYFSYNGVNNTLLTIVRDDKYIASMLKREAEFWKLYQNEIPPDLSNKDCNQRDDLAWKQISDKYRKNELLLKDYETLLQEQAILKESLIKLSGGLTSQGNNLKLLKVVSKGLVQYKNIDSLKDVNIDEHRGPDRISYKITIED